MTAALIMAGGLSSRMRATKGPTHKALVPVLGKPMLASYGCSNQRYEIFVADDLVDTGIAVDANEVIETRWFSKEELVELILKNGVVDNLSLSPLLLMLLREARGANEPS